MPVDMKSAALACGSCHVGPFVAFQDSKHYELLKAGDRNVPTCVTCHGNVAASVPSPKAVEARCDRCHGTKGVAPRPDRGTSSPIRRLDDREAIQRKS